MNINKILNQLFKNPTSIVFTIAVFGVGYYIGQKVLTGNVPFANPVPQAEKPEDLPMEDGPIAEELTPIEEFVDEEGNDAGFGVPAYNYAVAQTPANADNMMDWDNNEIAEVIDYYPPPSN